MYNLLCTICRESMCEDNFTKICSLPCGHVFHEECIIYWLERSATCPHCRVLTTPDKVFKLYFEVLIEDNDPDNAMLLRTEINRLSHVLENTRSELRLKSHDVNSITQQFNEISRINDSLRYECRVLHGKVGQLKTILTEYEQQKEQLNEALTTLDTQAKKVEKLTKELKKFQKVKKLLDGSVMEANETIGGNSLDFETLKLCYITIKRDFNAALDSEIKLKRDYGSLYGHYKTMERSNAEMREQLSIKDRIIESYKNELKTASKRPLAEENSPGPSNANLDQSTAEPTPKKRVTFPLRRSSREVARPSTSALLNKKTPPKPQLKFNGGVTSGENVNAKLKACKIVSNRKHKI